MASSRLLLAVVGGALAVALTSVGGLAYVALRTRPRAERLVREVNALARARHPRPAHVTPALPGTFAEHLDPLMDEVLRLYLERPEALGASSSEWPCAAVVEGRAPVSELPAVCREAVEGHLELVARVLAATHAEEGGLPETVGALASPVHPHGRQGMAALEYVVRLAGLETRLRLAQGKAAEAVDLCLDSLALSRELAAGGGLRGHMVSATGYGVLYQPCADALDAAPLARKRSAMTQLARVAEGFVPFSRTMKEASAVLQLASFGRLLPAELLAALPVGARDIAMTTHGSYDPARFLAARLAWWKTVTVFDAMVPFADHAPEARRRAFAAIDAREAETLVPVNVMEAAAYERFAERAELLRHQHDALLTLTEVDLERAETGRWPESLPHRAVYSFVLKPQGHGEALLEPCASALRQHGLRVTADPPANAWVQVP
jgi:hypothetical protein